MPYRSPAAALLFCILFGPVGLLYSSRLGGAILSVFGLLLVGGKLFFYPIALLWLISCIWGISAAESYNKRLEIKRHA